MNLVPVDYDPFADNGKGKAGPRLVPVDGDPFAPAFDASRFDMVKGSGDMGVSKGQSFGRGAIQGATIGAGDELAAVAAASPLPGQRQGGFNPIDVMAGLVRMGVEGATGGKIGAGGFQAADDRFAKETMLNDMAAHDNFWSNLGGSIVGGLAVPVGAANGFKQGAAIGAGLGGAYGFNSAAPDSRSGLEAFTNEGKLTGGVGGAAIGGVLGGVLGKLLGNSGNATPQAGTQVAQAADRLGVSVPLGIATDSTLTQRAAQGVRNVPFAGQPMVQATDNMLSGLNTVADDLATSLGSGDRVSAGQTISTAIRDWVGPKSQAMTKAAYDAVDSAINPNIAAPLTSTAKVAADIAARRSNANIAGQSKALGEIEQAISAPGGMNYQGLKDLRTSIGEKLNSGILPEGMSGAELKRIYGAITDDLKSLVAQAGGPRGLQLFERANSLNRTIQGRREALAKIVGLGGNVEAEKVFDRVLKLASDKSGGNLSSLAKVRNTVGQDWDEMASAAVARLGRDADGNLTPDRFVTAIGNLSEPGKRILFRDPAHRQAIDDIYTVALRAKEAASRFGNPSGTGQQVGFGAALAGMAASPVTTVGALLGGNVLSRIVSQPATAKSMSRFAKAYEMAVRKPGQASAAAVQTSARQFATELGEKLGVTIDASRLVPQLAGPRMAPASDSQLQPEEQN
jgi:hypothetical protein